MKYIILLILVIALVTAEDIRKTILSRFKDSSKKELFKAYHLVYKKDYELATEEGVQKYKNFKKNVNFIEEYNTEHPQSTIEINEFADTSTEEFKNNFLQEDCAKAHQLNNFKGQSYDICGNKSSVNLSIQSVSKIPQGKNVIFFEKEKCQGRAWRLNMPDNTFDVVSGIGFNAKSHLIMGSEEPKTGCVWFYDKPCFQGTKREFCEDLFDMVMFGLPGKIGSFRVNYLSFGVDIYTKKYYAGSPKIFYWTAYGISDEFSNSVGSMKFKTG